MNYLRTKQLIFDTDRNLDMLRIRVSLNFKLLKTSYMRFAYKNIVVVFTGFSKFTRIKELLKTFDNYCQNRYILICFKNTTENHFKIGRMIILLMIIEKKVPFNIKV